MDDEIECFQKMSSIITLQCSNMKITVYILFSFFCDCFFLFIGILLEIKWETVTEYFQKIY